MLEVLPYHLSYYKEPWAPPSFSRRGFVNNISAGLHKERLNRQLKDAINHLDANKTPSVILEQVIKAIGVMKDILYKFDATTGMLFTGKRTRRSEDVDLKKVILSFPKGRFFCTNVEERIICFHPLNVASF